MKKITSLANLMGVVALLAFASSCKKADKCPSAGGLKATSISGTSESLSWNAVSGAASYTIQYRPTGSSTWESMGSLNEAVTLSSLQTNTTYEWQVKTICSADVSAYSALSTFKTVGCNDGYEGVGCLTEVREKIIGDYDVAETCTISGGASYSVAITKKSGDVKKVLVIAFGGYPSVEGTVGVDGTSLTIASQTNGGFTFSGSGTINNNGATITMNYTITDGVNTETCTGTWTKK